MKTVLAFAAAPLGAIAVLGATLMTTVIKNGNWAGFAEALLGFGAIIYLAYCIGLVLILPVFFALKRAGRLSRWAIVGVGTSFGLLVGFVLSGLGWAWPLNGTVMGLASGLVLARLLPNMTVESGSPTAPAHF